MADATVDSPIKTGAKEEPIKSSGDTEADGAGVDGEEEDRDAGGLDEVEFKWSAGDDPLDVWLITDASQLETIPLPNPNKMPCEARPCAIRAFIKRGLKITKLAFAWWLTFNIFVAEEIKDLITIEQAIDVAIAARNARIFTCLVEFSTQEQMLARKPAVLEWFTDTTRLALLPKAHPAHLENASLLGETLVAIQWIREPQPQPQPTQQQTQHAKP